MTHCNKHNLKHKHKHSFFVLSFKLFDIMVPNYSQSMMKIKLR